MIQGYRIYDVYSGCLKIWLIANISYLSDANIANKISISLQYSNNTYDCFPLYSTLRTSKLQNILGLDYIEHIWKAMMAFFLFLLNYW